MPIFEKISKPAPTEMATDEETIYQINQSLLDALNSSNNSSSSESSISTTDSACSSDSAMSICNLLNASNDTTKSSDVEAEKATSLF